MIFFNVLILSHISQKSRLALTKQSFCATIKRLVDVKNGFFKPLFQD